MPSLFLICCSQTKHGFCVRQWVFSLHTTKRCLCSQTNLFYKNVVTNRFLQKSINWWNWSEQVHQTHWASLYTTFSVRLFEKKSPLCLIFFLLKDRSQWGKWQKNGGKEKQREVRRRVVKITIGCHPGPSLCGNEGLEATLLLPDAVRLLRRPLMHGPSHQDFSIRLPSTYTVTHHRTHVHAHIRRHPAS